MPTHPDLNAPAPDLNGAYALVTGASRGIGAAMAKALAEAGAHVLALARTVGGLEELDDEIRAAGGKCSLIPADLTEPEAIERLGPALLERFGRLDILLANAGDLGELAPLTDIDPEVWARALDVNVTANWRLIRTLDPALRASAAGRVIFMTSRVGGEEPRAFWGAYAVSKAAMEMLAQTYAEETAASDIRVAIVDPGAMRTRMRAKAMPGEDPKTLPDPSELAPLVLYAASEDYDGRAERLAFRDWKTENASS
ncbi:MAG: SDR family NAD(P)-dependent oxidoreductase [Pseudomonadota bacterium]